MEVGSECEVIQTHKMLQLNCRLWAKGSSMLGSHKVLLLWVFSRSSGQKSLFLFLWFVKGRVGGRIRVLTNLPSL